MSRKLRAISILFILAVLASACGSPTLAEPTQTQLADSPTAETKPTTVIATSTAQPTRTPRPFAPPQDEGFVTGKNDYFATSGNCVICHNLHIDQAGNDVSIGDVWRSSMMANSALDPYYLAGVSMNLARYPDYNAAIQSKCSTCHMPLAHTSDTFTGQESPIFSPDGYLDPEHPLHTLAVDGNSCTACHQIQDQYLGQFPSFSGGFVIDQDAPMGERTLYGRFELVQPSQRMMAMSSGFISLKGEHLLESEICATCHNLYTHYVTKDGSFSEEWFPEQTPYSEWLHSDFANRSTCQDCHLPHAEGSVVLSNLGPAGPRSPFGIHSFTGGNTYLLQVLNNFGGEVGIQSGPEGLDEAIERTLSQLSSITAELELSSLEVEGTWLSFDITTTVLTGHKFPTGYPSRRAWLHITVKDGDGELVFESGAFKENGAIQGNDNDEMEQAFEPHYDLITSPDQVQIYETILTDVENNLTTVLLAASDYLKDNRLLPAGFEKTTAEEDIQPKGAALTDEDFNAGRDTVRYQIEVGDATGPFTVEVELFYQSISYRWAMDLRAYDTEQILLFSEYYDATPNHPVLIAGQVGTSE
jgi:hypothetical protein